MPMPCRSNKGAPGVDRQDFEAVEAYGVRAMAGRTGACAPGRRLTDRTLYPDAFSYRRPTANSRPLEHLQPCGIGSA